MTAGEIVLVNFQGATGIKRRPAIIVSTEEYHQTRPDLVLGVITTQIDSANSPTDYLLKDWQTAGLRKPSAFRAYLGTYEQPFCTAIIGKVSDRDWKEVQNRLRLAIAINS
ncbi:MAG: type II toxin-antitoxin system PemK/MazF family toxin [Pyrinomonadaceae bacterium]